MSKPNDLDELLVAYADGELDPARRALEIALSEEDRTTIAGFFAEV